MDLQWSKSLNDKLYNMPYIDAVCVLLTLLSIIASIFIGMVVFECTSV